MTKQDFIREFIGRVRTETGLALQACQGREVESLELMVVRYEFYIRTMFLPWMVAAWVRLRSSEAVRSVQKNLLVEVSDDHPALLEDFARQCPHYADHWATIAQVHALAGPTGANRITMGISGGPGISVADGLFGLVVLAYLEAASFHIIPVLEGIGRVLQFNDLRYTQVHGEADAGHATELAAAVWEEAALGGVSLEDFGQLPGYVNAREYIRCVVG